MFGSSLAGGTVSLACTAEVADGAPEDDESDICLAGRAESPVGALYANTAARKMRTLTRIIYEVIENEVSAFQ